MRRALVLTDESARHSFRASLPPKLRKLAFVRRLWSAQGSRSGWRVNSADVSYCGCIVAVSMFIA
jgi:hypothetical protein